MKKAITIITASLVISGFAYAQDPATPNAGFENWTQVGNHYDPDSWNTLNPNTAILGVFTCTRASGVDKHGGNYAMKLTTKSVFGIKANGIATTATLITTPPYGVTGGLPFTGRPDSITGWYKYAPASAADSGFMELVLQNSNGDTIGFSRFTTPHTIVSTYTRFSMPVTYFSSANPTNSYWILTSSDGTNPVVNSSLYIDDLHLVYNPPPCNTLTGLSTTNIKATSFKANCSAVAGAVQYKFRYRVKGTAAWTTLSSLNPYKNIQGLTANTKYQWQARVKCSASPSVFSPWTVTQNCTTLVAREGESLSAVSDNNSMLILYPNPTNEKISLSFETGSDGIATLSIINQVGQTVLTKKVSVTNGVYNSDLDIRSYSKGIYTVRIQTDTESSFQKLLIQ